MIRTFTLTLLLLPTGFVFLKHAEQLGLRFQRQLTHLIEEQSTVVRDFEAAVPIAGRAGE